LANGLGAAFGRDDPRPALPRRVVPDVLAVAALELSDPMTFRILMKPDDPAL